VPAFLDGVMEVAWWLITEQWGKGFAAVAAEARLTHGLGQIR
jgi:RimJ/RimL family protein N-acetyltransferase